MIFSGKEQVARRQKERVARRKATAQEIKRGTVATIYRPGTIINTGTRL